MTNKKPAKQSKPRAKKFNLKQHVQKEYSNLQKMTSFTWDEESNTKIKYYEVFDVNTMGELFEEALSNLKYAEKHNLEFFKGAEGEIQFLKYVYFLIIKYFTELKSEIPDTFPEQITIMNQLIGLGHWDRFFNEILPPHQVERVIEKYEELIQQGNQIGEILQKELSKLDKLENKEILSKPFNVLSSPSPTNDVNE